MKNKTPLLITALIIVGLIAVFLAWELSASSKQNKNYAEEIAGLEAMMAGNGMNAMMEDDIAGSLKNLLNEYNSVNTENTELSDSIAIQKQKVIILLQELENSEKSKKYTARELYKMRKEAETLRKVMKNYVHKVDSLNTLNLELQATIKVKDQTISNVKGERDEFRERTENLSKTVEMGSKLQILGLTAEAIRVRTSGSFTETSRAKRADQVKACFTIVANSIAEKGSKLFYMRIISPEGTVLTNTKSTQIDSGGENIEVSVGRTLDYQGKAVDFCVFYEKSMDELPKGDYKVEIYSDGLKVGSTSFGLK